MTSPHHPFMVYESFNHAARDFKLTCKWILFHVIKHPLEFMGSVICWRGGGTVKGTLSVLP